MNILSAALPATIDVDFQPYGKETLGNLEWAQAKGSDGKLYPALVGTVLNGSSTSRLFQYTATKSTAGERRTVYAIKEYEMKRGLIIRVSM